MGKGDTSAANKIQEQINNLTLKLDEWKSSVSKELADLSKLVTDSLATQDLKIQDLTARVASLETDLAAQKSVNKLKDKKIDELNERLEETISHSRRLNIIINGAPEIAEEDISKVINDFFVHKLQIPGEIVSKFTFRDYHRIGPMEKNTESGEIFRKKVNKNSNDRDPHRAIIIAFTQQAHRNLIFTYAKNLDGTGLSVKPDLSQTMSKLRTKLLGIRKDIKKIHKDKLAILTYRSFKPVLLVRYDGETVPYTDDIDISECE